ncbi:MAG: alkaline phosphatase [Bacteroidales bacterium]|nr:alkaline phosphatase [Bacteroidales bacterium]
MRFSLNRLVLALGLLFFSISLNSFSQAKNVILMIGDGMGLAHAYSAYTMNNDSLNIFTMPITGLVRTACSDRLITDSGAGGTAFAIGQKAPYEAIGLDSLYKPHPSIMKLAKENGLSTSIIVSCDITHATPASFIANVKHRKMNEEIALAYLDSDIDIVIGGGLKNFLPNNRKDKLDLRDNLINQGYNFIYSKDSLEFIKDKTFALLYDSHPPKAKLRDNMLERGLERTIEVLSKKDKGFFIMLEGSQIDFESHTHSFDSMIDEVLDFDRAVRVALEFAKRDGNTLVIVIADHETGGLTMVEGDNNKGKFKDKWSTFNHTATMVPVYAFGKGSENFTGVMENTDVFYKIKRILDL